MIQKRPGLFETNSSTTHSLTITRGRVTPEVIEKFKKENGTHIVFGINSYDEIYNIIWHLPGIDENTPFQIKADILYISMYVWNNDDILEFLHNRNALQKKLEELGFTVEFREDPKLILNEGFHKSDVDENIFDYLWNDNNTDEVIDYLFDDHVLFYMWNDECYEECPKEIDEAEERFYRYKDTEEQKYYNYR